ncbi:MAG: TetR/AcrR family transcriptional regulator [Christensenellales bacterium]|jgi:AcrR family transcriptional regulator
MRKGEASKRRIIDAAEELFSEKGYTNTSVQDVLGALGISKGGFYHYFETKMDLLSAVCERRCEEWYAEGIALVRAQRGGAVEKLNAALKLVNTLGRERPALIGVRTELTLNAQDASIWRALRSMTIDMLAPLIEEILDAGVREKQFIVRRSGETARLLIMLALDVNEEASREITTRYERPDCAMNVLELLSAYRETMETIVNAPYGSIELFDLGDMISAITSAVADLKGTFREE